jgi:polynucleotide 5'-hydroxyl-kinase GRC3/NOL9
MAEEEKIDIPRQWEQLTLTQLHGTLLVIGAPDMGKSTFAQYLFQRLCAESDCVAYLDGDPGQSRLGPPTTMTMAVSVNGDQSFPPQGQRWRSFVGAVSPRGHMLPMLVSGSRLTQAAQGVGAETIVYDTTGLVDPAQGGTALKLAKIDLLRPTVVFAIQRGQELEALLLPLRRSRRVRVVDLQPSPARQMRDRPTRQDYRASKFAKYFASARSLVVDWRRLAVLPSPRFILNRLVALEDANGFTLGLGMVKQVDGKIRQVTLETPLSSLDKVDALRLGDLVLEPQTFRDQWLGLRIKPK